MSDGQGALLVVDDEPEVAAVLAEYLSDRGYATEMAGGGIEALSRIEKAPPAGVLLDVRMPDMDGLEVLRKIRAAGPRPPVLMMSANEDETVARRTIDLGAFDYVLKPFDFDQIEHTVRKMLGHGEGAPVCSLDEGPALPPPSAHGLLYDLALEVFRTTRILGPEARASLGGPMETGALLALQRSNPGDKAELIKALNQLRTLFRFARDLGDLDEDRPRPPREWPQLSSSEGGFAPLRSRRGPRRPPPIPAPPNRVASAKPALEARCSSSGETFGANHALRA